jgi:hypothetical protein
VSPKPSRFAGTREFRECLRLRAVAANTWSLCEMA